MQKNLQITQKLVHTKKLAQTNVNPNSEVRGYSENIKYKNRKYKKIHKDLYTYTRTLHTHLLLKLFDEVICLYLHIQLLSERTIHTCTHTHTNTYTHTNTHTHTHTHTHT